MIREVTIGDIAAIHEVRMAVKENILNNPSLVTHEDYVRYITIAGKGWVYEAEGTIVGFAIVSLDESNVWALFVDPYFENKGIGTQLHDTMLNWFFAFSKKTIWLSTAPGTRAEIFYRKNGWQEVGMKNGEVKFEMNYDVWQSKCSSPS